MSEQLTLFTEDFCPEFSRLVGEIRPRWILAENARQKPGILHIAADDVCTDLERQGYKVGIWDFEAAAVGAKHRRERIFFVAHTDSPRLPGSEQPGELRAQAEGRITHEPELSSSSYAPCLSLSYGKTARKSQKVHERILATS